MTIKTRYILILMVLAILTALALSTCFTSYSGGTGTIVINIRSDNSRAAFEPIEIKAFTHTITLTGPGETQTETIEGEGSVEFELIPGTWNIEVRAVGDRLEDYKDDGDYADAKFPSKMLRALSRETVEIKTGPNKPADIKMEAATEVENSKQFLAAINIAREYTSKEVILISEDITFDKFDPPPDINSASNIIFLADKPVKILFHPDASSFSIFVRDNATLTLGKKGMSGHLTIDGNNSIDVLFNINEAELIMEEGVTIQNSQGVAVNVTGFSYGGEVTNSYFTMNGGEISKNKAWDGGGVQVNQYGIFTMNGGEIIDNKAENGGGGVYVAANGTFTMTGGAISGNEADNGGGVYVDVDIGAVDEIGKFLMEGGTIFGNTATYNGGGVYVRAHKDLDISKNYNGFFKKTGGTIYGNDADVNRRNIAKLGEMSANYEYGATKPKNYGHAVFVDCFNNLTNYLGFKKVQNKTAGEDIVLDAANNNNWEKIVEYPE